MILPYFATALLVLVTGYSAFVSFRQNPVGSPRGWAFPSGTKRSMRIAVGICTIALAAAFVAWSTVGPKNSAHRSSRFLIPQGYVGWARVEFQVSGAPPAPVEDGAYVLKLPSSGLFKTSSPERFGWARDRYYYYSETSTQILPDTSQGSRSAIWGKINGEASGPLGHRTYEEFFVGTEQQFREQVNGNLNGASKASETPAN
jgi:hypothetical protein